MPLHQAEVVCFSRALGLLLLVRLVCCSSFLFGNSGANAPHLVRGRRGRGACLVDPVRYGSCTAMESHAAAMPTAGGDSADRADAAAPTGLAATASAGGSAAGATTETAVRLPAKHKHTPYRGDDGRAKRPRKGDAKRERKKRALAQATEMCQYYVDDHGLRRVRPYIYDFQTHTKERWLDRPIIDVFCAEFAGESRSHYENAIRRGLLTVNGKKVDLDYKLGNGDLICNRTHRHEPPVAGGDITIVSETDGEIAVDKPCTVPIHPCGSYRFNTLFYILQRQRPDLSLRVCHRLDRLTSGLTILAKTAERAGVIQKQIGSGATRKTYLARVSGDFGRRLPGDSRQAGSPFSPEDAAAAAPAAAIAAPTKERQLPPAPTEGGIASSEESGSPATLGPAAAAVEAENGNGALSSGLSGNGDAGDVGDSLTELWWRYESPGQGVVKGSARAEADADSREASNGRATDDHSSEIHGGVAAAAAVGSSGGDGGKGKGGVMIRVNCPIGVVDPKHGIYECNPTGKEAQTVIRKVGYDAATDTSVVECTPVHGRTHQIRLHLQWAGHPIANDPCYGGELHFGNPEAKRRAEENPASEGWKGVPRKVGNAQAGVEGTSAPVVVGAAGTEGAARDSHDGASASGGEAEGGAKRRADDAAAVVVPVGDVEGQRAGEDDDAFMVRTCSMCQGGERFKETQLHCVGIWLHALRYQGPDWAFETDMPSWATFLNFS